MAAYLFSGVSLPSNLQKGSEPKEYTSHYDIPDTLIPMILKESPPEDLFHGSNLLAKDRSAFANRFITVTRGSKSTYQSYQHFALKDDTKVFLSSENNLTATGLSTSDDGASLANSSNLQLAREVLEWFKTL